MSQSDTPKPRFPRKPSDRSFDKRRWDDEDDEFRDEAGPETLGPRPPRLAKIAGLQAVTALFRRDPSQVVRLYFDEKTKKAVGDLCAQMARMQRPYRLVEDSELQRIAGTVLHGGVVAAAVPRPLPDLDPAAAVAWAEAGEPLVILDGVGNPQNVGAIARTIAYFGFKRLLLSDHPGQAGLSDAAHRIAEGGLEHLAVYRAVNLPQLCRQLREHYRVVGTTLRGRAVELSALPDDPRPLALVLGNEENGLSAETLEACEAAVVIRGAGLVQSLNVSATAAILLHQMAARRLPPRSGKPPAGDAAKRRPSPSRPWKNRAPKPKP